MRFLLELWDEANALKIIPVICNCDLSTHGALVETCPCVPDRIAIWKCWLLRTEQNGSTWKKNPLGARERTNNKLNPHKYGADAGIWTRASFATDECSPTHCETLALPIKDEVARTKPEKIGMSIKKLCCRYSLLLGILQWINYGLISARNSQDCLLTLKKYIQ